MDAIEQFRGAMRAHGLPPPEGLEAGKLHRFSSNGKCHDDAGWCKLFADGQGGVFGDFRSGLSETWQAQREKPFTSAEREAFRQRCEAERRAREAEEARRHADAREKAATILEGATGDAVAHPYAIKKRVPFGPLVKRGAWPQRGWTDALLVPIYGGDGHVCSIEAINTDGDKDFLAGGKIGGGFHPFGKVRGADRVLIGEGLANAAVGSAVDGSPAAAALSASNFNAVALAVRKLAPGAEIIVLADNDVKPDGSNPGLKAAKEATAAVGGRVVVPDLGGRKCDFWDLWQERGPEAVQRAIAGAKAPPEGEAKHVNGDAPGGTATDSTEIIALEIGEILTRTFTPKESILSPWLRRQDLAMIYSKRGVGKTYLCLALAYAIASGGKFLKWQAPEPRRVLYIDGEMPGVAIQERLSAIVKANEMEPPEGFFRIVTPDVQPFSIPDLATPEGQAAFQPLLGDSEVIITDNLSVLVRAGVENEGESWIPIATWALARRREGRSVVFVHHAGKSGQQRGSSRREDLLDTVICLKHPSDYTPEQGARFEMVFEKARGLYGPDVETIEAALQANDGKAVWTWKAAEGATADRIAKLVGMGMKPAEIASELGIHRSNVYRAISSRNGGKP